MSSHLDHVADEDGQTWIVDRKFNPAVYERVPLISLEEVFSNDNKGDDVIATSVWLNQPAKLPPKIGRHVPLQYWAIEATDKPSQGQPIGIGGWKAPRAPTASGLPASFSWANPDDVVQRFAHAAHKVDRTLASQLITPVRDQSSCGSCWAFASAGISSDRYAISRLEPAVERAPTHLLSCMLGTGYESSGYDAGYPQEAGTYVTDKVGICLESCMPYDTWCCKSTTPPTCNTRCTSGVGDFQQQLIKGQPGSTHAVQAPSGKPEETVQAIKENLYMYGPSVGAFIVYSDFQPFFQANPTGVYIKGATNTNAKAEGGHAVRIIGWEAARADRPECWVVRNSWGTSFGDKGDFRYAMWDSAHKYNQDCGLDVPLNPANGQEFGGVTAWLFPAAGADPSHFHERSRNREAGDGTSRCTGDEKTKTIIGTVAITLAAVAVIALLVVAVRRHRSA